MTGMFKPEKRTLKAARQWSPKIYVTVVREGGRIRLVILPILEGRTRTSECKFGEADSDSNF